ncbi:MAG: NUDIX hydrolase [Gammaproteobacteria bacterium]
MNYCSNCGETVVKKVPAGDNQPRFVCQCCQTIHYQNPKIVTGCLPVWEDSVLLCRRAIEPRYGLWTLPAGFMENDETVLEAALRETHEEARARVDIIDLYALFNLPHVNQVYMMFRAELLDLDYSAGAETLDVRLFKREEIPWDQIAFRTIEQTLKFYFLDRETGTFRFHMGDIVRERDRTEFVQRRYSFPGPVP